MRKANGLASVVTLLSAPPPKPRIGTMRSMQSQAERSNESREISAGWKLLFHRLSRCNLLVPIIAPGTARSRVIQLPGRAPATAFVGRTRFRLAASLDSGYFTPLAGDAMERASRFGRDGARTMPRSTNQAVRIRAALCPGSLLAAARAWCERRQTSRRLAFRHRHHPRGDRPRTDLEVARGRDESPATACPGLRSGLKPQPRDGESETASLRAETLERLKGLGRRHRLPTTAPGCRSAPAATKADAACPVGRSLLDFKPITSLKSRSKSSCRTGCTGSTSTPS